jgi:hypothetical protein
VTRCTSQQCSKDAEEGNFPSGFGALSLMLGLVQGESSGGAPVSIERWDPWIVPLAGRQCPIHFKKSAPPPTHATPAAFV